MKTPGEKVVGKSPHVISMDRTYSRTESWIRERKRWRGRDAEIASGGQTSRQESRYFRRILARTYARLDKRNRYDRYSASRRERYTLTGFGLMDLLDRRGVFVVEPSRARHCATNVAARDRRGREKLPEAPTESMAASSRTRNRADLIVRSLEANADVNPTLD